MPNSGFLTIGDYIAQLAGPDYIPEAKLPSSVTLKNSQHI